MKILEEEATFYAPTSAYYDPGEKTEEVAGRKLVIEYDLENPDDLMWMKHQYADGTLKKRFPGINWDKIQT